MGVTCSSFNCTRVLVTTSSKLRRPGRNPGIRRSAILEAAATGNVAVLSRLLELDMKDINISGVDGRTPLHLACAEGHLEAVQYLIKNGANVNSKDRWGAEPMKEAILHGCIHVARALSEIGVLLSKESSEDLECTLLQSVSAGDMAKVKILIESGISVNAVDYDRRALLHLAAAKGHLELLNFLILKGADVHATDRWGATAMSDAMLGEHIAIQDALRAAGLSEGTACGADRDALEVSSERSTVKDRNSRSASVSWSEQRSMVNTVMEAAAAGDVAELRRLVDAGADVNAADYDQRSPMHLVCSEGHLDAALYLMSVGASVTVKDRWGSEPLMDAFVSEHFDVVDAMLAAGIRLSKHGAMDMSATVCKYAAAGRLAQLYKLVGAGAAVDATDYEGRTALQLAAADGHADVVDFLLAAGADWQAKDRTGETALTLAISGCHLEVQRLLQDVGAKLCYGSFRKQGRRRKSVSGIEAIPEGMLRDKLAGREAEPVARELVSVYFSDIVGFATLSSDMDGARLSSLLNRLFKKFDHLAELHSVQKVDVIGDAYIAATNFSQDQPEDHAARLARFALAAAAAAQETLVDEAQPAGDRVQIRVGLHCGPVSGTIVGTTDFKYTMFGDTVNTASRMESTSLPGRIQCSEAFGGLVVGQAPDVVLASREGGVEVKGKGHMKTYWIDSQRLPDRVWNRPLSV